MTQYLKELKKIFPEIISHRNGSLLFGVFLV